MQPAVVSEFKSNKKSERYKSFWDFFCAPFAHEREVAFVTGDCLNDFVKSGFLAFDLITSSVRLCSDQKQRPCQFLSFALQQGGFCGHPPASFSNRLPQPCRFQDKILLWLLHGRRRHRSVDRPVLPPKASGSIAFSMNHWRCRCLKFCGKRHKKESMVSGNRCKPNAGQSSLGYAEAQPVFDAISADQTSLLALRSPFAIFARL